jgi:plasmid stabilization system protein ParE
LSVTFHRLVAKDIRHILAYYEKEAGSHLSARFYREFERVAAQIRSNPQAFHSVSDVLRRANFRGFPYHLLFRMTGSDAVRILVLRHHSRHPDCGIGRE